MCRRHSNARTYKVVVSTAAACHITKKSSDAFCGMFRCNEGPSGEISGQQQRWGPPTRKARHTHEVVAKDVACSTPISSTHLTAHAETPSGRICAIQGENHPQLAVQHPKPRATEVAQSRYASLADASRDGATLLALHTMTKVGFYPFRTAILHGEPRDRSSLCLFNFVA